MSTLNRRHFMAGLSASMLAAANSTFSQHKKKPNFKFGSIERLVGKEGKGKGLLIRKRRV